MGYAKAWDAFAFIFKIGWLFNDKAWDGFNLLLCLKYDGCLMVGNNIFKHETLVRFSHW